jgi:NAD(P)-dependent dehydrogenase (short-subunit alcohol dehydrogenase family)
VNNAGASMHGPLDQVDLAEFGQILQLNVVGLLAVTQAVLPAMREQGFGRIVNISSGTTRRVAVGVGAYASTKTAVNMLSAVLRQELAGDGIACRCCCPRSPRPSSAAACSPSAPRPGRACWCRARTTRPASCYGCCAPAKSRSISRTARSSPTSPRCPGPPDPRLPGGTPIHLRQ